MTAATRRRALRLAPVFLLAMVGGGALKWSHKHHGIISPQGNPASVRCYQCHGPLAHRIPKLPEGRAFASPTGIALSADGSRLFVTLQETDEVAVLDSRQGGVIARWPAGKGPHGLAAAPGDEKLWVALHDEDRVVELEPATGDELGSVPVGRMPRGLALTPDGKTIAVANSGSDDVSLVDTGTLTERCRLSAGREPYDVAIDPGGRYARVLNRMAAVTVFPDVPAAEVTTIDLARGRVVERARAHSAHLGEGIRTAADGRTFLSLVRVRNLVPITQVAQGWVMTSMLGVLEAGDDEVLQLPLDEVNAYFADPSGVAVDVAHARAYVASGGGDCVTVVDLDRAAELAEGADPHDGGPWADNLGVSSEYVLARIPVAANPRALLLSPDGSRLYVAERLGASVAVIDTGSLAVTSRFVLDSAEPDRIRRGDILFHNASVTFQGQFSCRSCHPDGHVDGLAYDFAIDGIGKNILDNRSLLGLAGTAPFKWNGKNRNLFEQCGPRFARVLTRSDPFAPEDLKCLVTYILSLPPPRPAGGADAASVARGRAIFERTRKNDGTLIPKEHRCSSCHQPPLYTSRLRQSIAPRLPTDTVEEFDVAHLRGVADSAPYLHDGRAATLEEIWTVYSPGDTHGVVNDLTKEQLNDLVDFLKAL